MAGTFDDGSINFDTVDKIHRFDDVDVRNESHHHTLGPGPTQAAAGGHRHRGGDSELLYAGQTISGSRSNGTAVASMIALLVSLGATDQTTA